MSFAPQPHRPAPGELFLDHVSHFVPDLEAAAQALEALGLCVTPRSEQFDAGEPVGAANRCVMLEEGYIELLSPTRDTATVRRMRALMDRFVGVHLACFGTPDAQAEHARLAAYGFDPQPLVNLERALDDGSLARFKVVRPSPESMPEGRIQYVEQLTPENLWREKVVNRLTLRAVYVVADDPIDTAARWARFLGLLPHPDGDFVRLECKRGRVVIGTQAALSRLLGDAPPPPALAGYALACPDPGPFIARCSRAGLSPRKTAVGFALRLPAALGGTWLLSAPSGETLEA